MRKKCRKTFHSASIAVTSPSDEARKDILRLYNRIRDRQRSEKNDPPPFFEEGNTSDLNIEHILEGLHSDFSEVIICALKTLAEEFQNYHTDVSRTFHIIKALVRTNNDEDVRYEAAKTIGKIRAFDLAEVLNGVLVHDQSERVKASAIKSMGLIKATQYFNKLVSIVNDIYSSSVVVRKAAVFALGRFEPDTVMDVLVDTIISDPDIEVREVAADSISVGFLKMGIENTNFVCQKIASRMSFEKELSANVRIAVINAVTLAEAHMCVDELLYVLANDPVERVRGQAAHALGHFFDPRIEKSLLTSLKREEGGIRKRVALALAQYAMKNPLSLHDEICSALIEVQKEFPKYSYIWKEAVKALPAC